MVTNEPLVRRQTDIEVSTYYILYYGRNSAFYTTITMSVENAVDRLF